MTQPHTTPVNHLLFTILQWKIFNELLWFPVQIWIQDKHKKFYANEVKDTISDKALSMIYTLLMPTNGIEFDLRGCLFFFTCFNGNILAQVS